MTGIYKIESKVHPDRCYIGSAFNINCRWDQHTRLLRNGKHPNPKLQNHFNKYNGIDLKFSILLGCDKEDLLKIEQFFFGCL